MAEQAAQAGEGEEAAEKPKLGVKKLAIFVALPALVVVLGGVAAALLLTGGKKDDAHAEAGHEAPADGHAKPAAHADAGHSKGGKAAPPAAHVVFYELPDLLVNIQSQDSRPTYLKLKITLELDSPDIVAQIEPAMPRVLDRFQAFLRELRIEDLTGSAGSYRLRLELLRRVNLAVAPAEARAVLIEEVLIQ